MDGSLTVLVCADPADAEPLADRLGGLVESDVVIGGHALPEAAVRDVRSAVAVVTNRHRLFTGTLRDNIDPHDRHGDAGILRFIDAAAAADAVDSLGGIDGSVNKDGVNLSGGQRQRVRLARVLAHEAAYLCALEPTSALDAYTEARVADGVRSARQTMTTLIVTRSPMWTAAANHVVFLDTDGTVHSGSHAKLGRTFPSYSAATARS